MSANFTPEKEDYGVLTPFKMQVLTNFPYIEADFDALTNYGLLCKIVEYLNNVIANENEVTEQVNSLYNAYVALQNYVNTYFDNLDVQEEINNKLDEMAEDGSLTNLIKGYVDPIYQAYENSINETIALQDNKLLNQDLEINTFKSNVNSQITVIDDKVTNAVSGSPLVASDVSEMTETNRVYVNTTDGKWYYYDGDSWEIGGTYQSTSIGENEIDIANLKTNLKSSINGEIVTKGTVTNTYLTWSGQVADLNNYTVEELYLYKGDILQFTGYGTTGVAMLSSFKIHLANNEYYPIIRGEGSLNTYQHTALYSGYYYISSRFADLTNIKIYRKNIKSSNNIDSNNIIKNDTLTEITADYYINQFGVYTAFSNYENTYYASDFIRVLPDKKIVIETFGKQLAYGSASTTYGLCFYDEDKKFISFVGYPNDTNKKEVTSPRNASYIRYTLTSAWVKNGYAIYYKDLKELIENDFNFLELYKSFDKVGVVGDSLASGESAYKEDNEIKYVDLYEYSWPQFMARMSGNEYINFSQGGLTTRTWLTVSRGYTKALLPENKCKMYYMAIGTNDVNYLGHDYLGSSSDIDTSDYHNNEDTFYGNYAGIIQRLKEIQPKAKFFLFTIPRTETRFEEFNQAIKTICSMFNNCYLIDLLEHIEEFSEGSFNELNKRSGHYNANGYNNIAQLIAKWTSQYMYNNYSEFRQIEFIGTNYIWTD